MAAKKASYRRGFDVLRSATRGFAEAMHELFPPMIEADLATALDEGWTLGSQNEYCHRCGNSAGPGEATDKGCSHCVGQAMAWDGMVRLGPYEKPLEQWIIAMKFRRVWPWATWFGRELAGVISEVGDADKTLVCHVPMPRLRRWRRGYNQARLIAGAMAKSARLPLMPILRRKGWQPPQTTLPASQRAANLRNSITLANIDLTGWHVWLVDDVKTTGSTLAACARMLKKAGATSVHGAVVAVADPKRS